MRHLNKIVFLDSANIPYAEVKVDGNVHFSGTQGVGKSTVLRALLFFYNADKMRLGIQPGQKPFDEFYFPNSNSYIIYEVKTDKSAYCILAFRSQGKVAYRFIDAPYKKEWFVEEDGRVESDWVTIRERLKGIDHTGKIDTLETYRDIIFGNTRYRDHRYDKYAIVESPKYQNIPRSIQNVFLNSKLDANFVKNTIIESMSDQTTTIHLDIFRNLVRDFEREYKEINCWFKKDSNGVVVVRSKADIVIKTYRTFVALGSQMQQLWHQLNYVVKRSKDQIPQYEDEIKDLKKALDAIGNKLKEMEFLYQQEHDKLSGQISILKDHLDTIKKKLEEYERINIREILDEDSREPLIQGELKQEEELLKKLSAEYQSVTERYEALFKVLDNEWTTYELEMKEILQRHRGELQNKQSEFQKSKEERTKTIEADYQQWLEKSEERRESFQEAFNRADKQRSQLKYYHPLQAKMDEAKQKISQLEQDESRYKADLELVKNKLKSTRNEAQLKHEQIEKDYDVKLKQVHQALEEQKKALEETNQLLSRWEGSLYEWLAKNKPGWENTIGKVIDEQNVLYAQGLKPQLADGESLCGVTLDWDSIPTHHRTPDDYRELQKEQEKTIAETENAISELQSQQKQELEKCVKNYNGIIRDFKQKEESLTLQIEQCPRLIRDAKTSLHKIEQEEQELIKTEEEKRDKAFNRAHLDLEHEKEEQKKRRNTKNAEIEKVKKECDQQIYALQMEFNDFRQQQEENKKGKKAEIDSRRRHYEQQEREELNGKGADTNAIDRCKAEIRRLNDILRRISEHKKDVYGYQKDEKEYFSHEAEWQMSKAKLEAQEKEDKSHYEAERKNVELQKKDKLDSLKKKEEELRKTQEGLRQYDNLCQIERCIPNAYLQDIEEEKTLDTCSNLVTRMRGAVTEKRQKQTELNRAVNAFNTHFSADNTFHFIIPQFDEDYLEYAVNLQDFVENNKIEDFRSRVSSHFTQILESVSREVGMLMKHSAEIRGIINKINNDFQKKNFAGVIRSIEMKSEDSDDRLMSALKTIHDFTQQNVLNIGNANLFSGDDRDKVNEKVVHYIMKFVENLEKEPARKELTLSDTFRLRFRIVENDNSTGWVERITNVGSDGTDILVKAMINIMLINVFKEQASRKNGDFIIHCMMDEIGKLHPTNVKGILQFANQRNIYLINSSPMSYNADIYKHNYLMTKDIKSKTRITRLITKQG